MGRHPFFFVLLSLGLSSGMAQEGGAADSTVQPDSVDLADSLAALDTAKAPVDTTVLPGSQPPPFELKRPSRREVLRYQTNFRRALLAFRSGKPAEAAAQLRRLQAGERLAEAYRTSFFAHASLMAGRKQEADSALEATLRWIKGAGWQRHFFDMRLRAFNLDSAAPAVLKAFCAQALASPVEGSVKAEILFRLLRLDSANLNAEERQAALRQWVRQAPADKRMDSVYKTRAPLFPPGRGTWEEQKFLLDWENKLGLTQKALDRSVAMVPMAPGKAEKQSLHWNYANLWFRKGDYREALKSYRLYGERYGDTPDLFLQMARLYRNTENPGSARDWYSRLAERFPKHPKTLEIFWMWAFDAEMESREDALELYARIAGEYPGTKRGDWAPFRAGLLYYKRGDYQAALELFRSPAGGPTSPVRQASLFWEAKVFDALKDGAGARAARLDLAARFPFGFYGHLARVQMEAHKEFPDSLSWTRRLATSRPQVVRSWLRESVPGFKDTLGLSGESAYLPLEFLLEWRLDTLAVRTMRTLPAQDFRNPWAMYVYAAQCGRAGLWRDAFLFGSRLADLMPLELWGSAPRPVLRKLYPYAYPDVVRRSALREGLPSALVFALMKQESGFDAKAVSRAGARGLMQMMPGTGTLQAKREGLTDFTPDRLFDPDMNARLGAAFLGDVVRRYEGNLYFALAHYNAGPTALGRWLPRLAGRLPEDAVEDIDFAETREYVKRVLANYWTYQALYE